jgi:predicted nucleotidyltransferase component of viral defense system
MISRRELDQLRAEWTLDVAVIEKDYLLGWLLAGIASHPVLGRAWVFKGGTCLRKCYYETFRFSEDLDFTVMPDGDAPLPGGRVLSYSITELFAEKLRALTERCRPRDLYDVVHMHRHPDLIGRQQAVAAALARKCEHAGIEVPPSTRSSPPRFAKRSKPNGRTCSATSSPGRSRPSQDSGPRWMTCSTG